MGAPVEEAPVRVARLPSVAMLTIVAAGTREECLSPKEADRLGRLLGHDVCGVRVHGKPRSDLYESVEHAGRRMLTVMLTQSFRGKADLLDDEPAGQDDEETLTIFYQTRPREKCLMDTPAGLVKMSLTPEEG